VFVLSIILAPPLATVVGLLR